MAVNSPQHTLLCVIKLFACLSSLYEQDIPFLDFVVLSVVIFFVSTRAFVGREVGIIWRLYMEPGRGQRRRRSSQRHRSDGEPSPPLPTHGGGTPGENLLTPLHNPHQQPRGGVSPGKSLAHPVSLGEGGC